MAADIVVHDCKIQMITVHAEREKTREAVGPIIVKEPVVIL